MDNLGDTINARSADLTLGGYRPSSNPTQSKEDPIPDPPKHPSKRVQVGGKRHHPILPSL